MRAPVVEDLQPPSLNVGFLDVNPVVLHQLLVLVFYFHLLQKQANGDEIAILQRVTHLADIYGHWYIQGMDEFLNGHRREEIISIEAPLLSGSIVPAYRNNAAALAVDAGHVEVGNDLTSHREHFLGH